MLYKGKQVLFDEEKQGHICPVCGEDIILNIKIFDGEKSVDTNEYLCKECQQTFVFNKFKELI